MPQVTPTNAYRVAGDKARAYPSGGQDHITIQTTDGTIATATTGDVVIVDGLAGIALTSYDSTNDEIVIDIAGTHEVSVKGHNGSTNAAVKIGDIVCYDPGGGSPLINVNTNTGLWIGIALAPVSSGATTTIPVRFIPGLAQVGVLTSV